MSDKKPEGENEDIKVSESPVSAAALAVAQVAKEIPIYQDLAQPATIEVGKGLGGLMKYLTQPFQKWGIIADRNLERFEQDYKASVSKISEKNIIPPPMSISFPALQAVSYLGDQEELRKMFAQLLANASDIDIAREIHPSFIEMIKQMSPDEANLLKHFKTLAPDGIEVIPILRLVAKFESGVQSIRQHMVDYDDLSERLFKFENAINNLIRLGIIEVDYSSYIVDQNEYKNMVEFIKSHFDGIEIRGEAKIPDGTDRILAYELGVLKISNFGLSFMKVCVPE